MKKFLIIHLLCVFAGLSAIAQNETLDNMYWSVDEKPAQFNGYIETPVGYFTGTPQVTIPLYNLQYKDIAVPISLNYNASSVKVPDHAGWTGLGWNLSSIGSISRQTNGNRDEYKIYTIYADLMNTALPLSDYYETSIPTGYLDVHGLFDLQDISSSDEYTDLLEDHYILFTDISSDDYPGASEVYDVYPDVFHFSFLNYSGKFMLNEDGEWVVAGDSDMKIEHVLGDFDMLDPPREIGMGMGLSSLGHYQQKQQVFEKFIITTPDGFKFEFGGANATEYTLSASLLTLIPPHADTWYLSKITSPKGNEVNFTYEPGDKTIYLTEDNRSHEGVDMDNPYVLDSGMPAFHYGHRANINHDHANYPISFKFPVYLKEISWNSGKVAFESSRMNDLPYILPGLSTFIPYRDMLDKYYYSRDQSWETILERSYEGDEGSNNEIHGLCIHDFYLFGYEKYKP